MIENADEQVSQQFSKSYSLSSITSGKTFWLLKLPNSSCINFLNFEIAELKKGKKLNF